MSRKIVDSFYSGEIRCLGCGDVSYIFLYRRGALTCGRCGHELLDGYEMDEDHSDGTAYLLTEDH